MTRNPKANLTRRVARAVSAPTLERRRIFDIRHRLGLSQSLFAAALNVSPETVKAWEQGKRTRDGAALRLLQIAAESLDLVLRNVRPTTDEGGGNRHPSWVRTK